MKKFFALLVTLLLAIALVGCSSANTDGGDEEAVSNEPIKIGLIQDITGATSTLGNMVYEGAKYAAGLINEAGGVNGREIEVLVYDTAASTDEALNGFTKAVTEDEVSAIIGPPVGNIAHALKTFTEDYDVPVLCFAGDINIYKKEDGTTYKNMFLFQPDLNTNAGVMYNWAVGDGGLTSFGVLYNESNSYSVTIAEEFLKRAEADGTTITDTVVFNADSTDFVTLLTKVTANNPDAIFAPCYTAKNILIVQAAEQIGYTGKIIMGLDACSPFQDKAGVSDLSNAVWVNNVDEEDATIQEIAKYILDTEGIEVTNKFFMGYDAMNILAQVIGEVGDDPVAIRDAVENLSSYQGLTGLLTMDPSTHAISPAAGMIIGTFDGLTPTKIGRYYAE